MSTILMPRSMRPTHLAPAAVRNAALRDLYATTAAGYLPRLLGAIDRNPYRKTYGCLDRQFWHYRTSDFPSEMYQEGVLPLAQTFACEFPGNRWYGEARLRELAIAALRFSAKSSHADGSCDDYYPYERALGAAVFSLVAATEAYRLLALEDESLLAGFRRRADWIVKHDESGRLTNHHALAALGLARTAQATGDDRYARASEARVHRVLEWQSREGWFEEYGGADPGYQSVTIDCLAKYRKLTGATWLEEPLSRALAFARLALHPDDSYGGEYGSRGTHHFYPHGMELLASEHGDAAALAEAFLRGLSMGKQAWFEDDRLFAHRLGNLIEAWQDWQPRAAMEADIEARPRSSEADYVTHLPQAGLLFVRSGEQQTAVSTARGGVFKHFRPKDATSSEVAPCEPEAKVSVVTDAGLVVETTQGRVAVSQMHDRERPASLSTVGERTTLRVEGPLYWTKSETATPAKLVLFRLGLLTVGRWCRTLIRQLLQRRLITGRRAAPIQMTRVFEWHATGLTVTDTIVLLDSKIAIERMSYGTDHQSVYVAASGVYQDGVLEPWTSLDRHVHELNERRRVTISREYPGS